MPLLKKEPFIPNPSPEDLKPEEDVFFCPLTKEIYREYDNFFNRIILLNSLVWTCGVTGRSGLTFEEALQSEQHAQVSLESFPESLENPILFVTTLTYRGRIDDLVSDVWTFMKERYFLGEEVEVFTDSVRRLARIISINFHENSTSKLPQNEIVNQEKKSDEPGVVAEEQDTQLSGKRLKETLKAPYPSHFTYDVEFIDDSDSESDSDSDEEEKEKESCRIKRNIMHCAIFRQKSNVTKAKLKLYLKNACEVIEDRWAVKDGLLEQKKREKEQEKQKKKKQKEREKEKKLQEKEREKNKKKHKKKNEEPSVADLEKERIREEKKREREIYLEWRKPRDDLQCDDLKPLPEYSELNLPKWLSSEVFGQLLSLFEFFHCFKEPLKLEVTITVDVLVDALISKDPEGSLIRIFMVLLEALFTKQDEEDGDEANLDNKEELQGDTLDLDSKLYGSWIREATAESERVRMTHELMRVFADQLLTFSAFREFEEEKVERLKQMKIELKSMKFNDSAHDKEAKNAVTRREYEERLKDMKERWEQERAEKQDGKEDSTEPNPIDKMEIPERPKPSKRTVKLQKFLQTLKEGGGTASLGSRGRTEKTGGASATDINELLVNIAWNELGMDLILRDTF